jgi:hypothetical protein
MKKHFFPTCCRTAKPRESGKLPWVRAWPSADEMKQLRTTSGKPLFFCSIMDQSLVGQASAKKGILGMISPALAMMLLTAAQKCHRRQREAYARCLKEFVRTRPSRSWTSRLRRRDRFGLQGQGSAAEDVAHQCGSRHWP